MTAFMLLSFIPMQLKAGTETSTVSIAATKTAESADINTLIARVDKINSMDRSTLSSSEKKELRKELRTIKSDLKERSKSDLNASGNGGVYLSVGAIIIIILLLILLL